MFRLLLLISLISCGTDTAPPKSRVPKKTEEPKQLVTGDVDIPDPVTGDPDEFAMGDPDEPVTGAPLTRLQPEPEDIACHAKNIPGINDGEYTFKDGKCFRLGCEPDSLLVGYKLDLTPQCVPANNKVASRASGGYYHTCASLNGMPHCWGNNNSYAALGLGHNNDDSFPIRPVAVPFDTMHDIWIELAATHHTTCAVNASRNQIYCWGWDYAAGIDSITGVKLLSPQLLDKTVSGDIFGGWSQGKFKSLVHGLPDYNAVDSRAYCALQESLDSDPKRVWCWGESTNNMLGTNTDARRRPQRFLDTASDGAVSVALGRGFACLTKGNGMFSCVGRNENSQFGDGTTTSAAVFKTSPSNLSGVKGLSASLYQGFAIAGADNSIYSWGFNKAVLGRTPETKAPNTTPASIGPTQIVQMTAGNNFACALQDTGSVGCWGSPKDGRLGNNPVSDSDIRSPITLGLTKVYAIGSGEYHACASNPEGLHCWGYNAHGQVSGDTTKSNSVNSPILIWPKVSL